MKKLIDFVYTELDADVLIDSIADSISYAQGVLIEELTEGSRLVRIEPPIEQKRFAHVQTQHILYAIIPFQLSWDCLATDVIPLFTINTLGHEGLLAFHSQEDVEQFATYYYLSLMPVSNKYIREWLRKEYSI